MSKSRKAWYELRAQGADAYELLIYDDIGKDWWGDGIAAQDLVEELNEVSASTIDVRINSYGGYVMDGLAIFNALVRHEARVVTYVDGIAASIASVIALAGDEVRIAENAFLMVHNAWGIVLGNAEEMRSMADVLDKLDGSIAQTYQNKTEAERATVLEWMAAETWFTADEALDVGLVDAVDDQKEIEASFDLRAYHHVPDQVAARFGADPMITPERPNPRELSGAAVEQFAKTVDAFAENLFVARPVEKVEREEATAAALDSELLVLAAESFRTLEQTRL